MLSPFKGNLLVTYRDFKVPLQAFGFVIEAPPKRNKSQGIPERHQWAQNHHLRID